MTRKEILSKIEETFNKIYAFTDRMGDEALNILDDDFAFDCLKIQGLN